MAVAERAAERAVRRTGRGKQNVEAQLLQQLRFRRLVEHVEARRDVGLERELMQQLRAEGMDGLHLQAARRLQRRGEQPPRQRARAASTGTFEVARIAASSAASSSAIHSASRSNTRFAMLAAAALVKVMQRIFAGSTPSSSRRITRCASTWVLPEPALAATHADVPGIGGLGLLVAHRRRE